MEPRVRSFLKNTRQLFALSEADWALVKDQSYLMHLALNHGERGYVPELATASTQAMPGSKAKLEVLSQRVLDGEDLWHPADSRRDPEGSLSPNIEAPIIAARAKAEVLVWAKIGCRLQAAEYGHVTWGDGERWFNIALPERFVRGYLYELPLQQGNSPIPNRLTHAILVPDWLTEYFLLEVIWRKPTLTKRDIELIQASASRSSSSPSTIGHSITSAKSRKRKPTRSRPHPCYGVRGLKTTSSMARTRS